MKFKLLKKYFSIIFAFATIIGALHHHHDLKTHPECKICVMQSNIIDIDVPIKTIYLTKIDRPSESIILQSKILNLKYIQNQPRPRSPPKFS